MAGVLDDNLIESFRRKLSLRWRWLGNVRSGYILGSFAIGNKLNAVSLAQGLQT